MKSLLSVMYLETLIGHTGREIKKAFGRLSGVQREDSGWKYTCGNGD